MSAGDKDSLFADVSANWAELDNELENDPFEEVDLGSLNPDWSSHRGHVYTN